MKNLFQKYIRYKRKLNEKKFNQFEKEQIIHLDKDEVIEEGIFKFKNLKKSGFCTFYCGLSFWNIKSDYFKESRKASLKIKNLTRVYIIKDVSSLNNEYLISQILEDVKANTRAYICHYDDISEIESKKDFGIWDDEYVCVVHYNADNLVIGITVSGRKEDLTNALRWQNNISKVSLPVTSRTDIKLVKKKFAKKVSTTPADRYKEFQHRSIELQMSIAAKECTSSHIDPKSCQWYHSSWPILRALNVVSTPNWHDNFYTNSIYNYAKKNNAPLRILISASADATILEHIESAIGNLSRTNIWLIDLCPTPLEIGRLYAKLRNITIHTVQMNALHLRSEGVPQNFFDLVITDAFITRFKNLQEKEKLIQEWNGILKRGGQIITTCRVTGETEEVGNKNDRDIFIKKTLRVFDNYCKRSPSILKYINKRLVQLSATHYSKNIVSYPISEVALHDIFSKNNFNIENKPPQGIFTKKVVTGEFKTTTYTQIVAIKL